MARIHQPGGPGAGRRPACAAPLFLVRPTRHERQSDQRDDQQEHDEPQVPDAEPAEVVAAVLHVPAQEVAAGQVVPVGAGVAGVEAAAEPGLRRYEDEEPEHEGDQQALDPLPGVLTAAALAQGEVGGASRQEEEEWHVPHGYEPQETAHPLRERGRLGIEGIASVEDAQRVEREQQQHRQDPQPVDEVDPRSLPRSSMLLQTLEFAATDPDCRACPRQAVTSFTRSSKAFT